jgi:hypothetical protein
MTLTTQKKNMGWAITTLRALVVVALATTCANATIVDFDTLPGGNNSVLPSTLGSNLSSDSDGATVSNGATPDIALTWAGNNGGWDLYSGATYWAVLGGGSGKIAQMESPTAATPMTVTLTVAAGKTLVLNSVDIGMATDKTDTYYFDVTISEVGGGEVFSTLTAAMDGDGGSGVQALTLNLNFTGTLGTDYVLAFNEADSLGNTINGGNGGGIDNLSFNQADAAGTIVWSAETTSAITTNSATASASVDTALTNAVLVWEETATAPNPGTTNDWTYHPSLGPKNAGPVTAPISSLSADTEYTWRFYGETASTNGWSAATTFVTALSNAQAPAFTNAEATSSISIQLGWDDNAANETGYILRRSLNSGAGPYTTIDVGNTTSYSDSGLSAATTYYYELVATNSANGSATDFADCTTNATTLAPSAGQTVIEINGMTQGNNVDLPSDFGSNLSASIPGATVSDGGTPQIALAWGGDWETHGHDNWNHLDPASGGVDILQIEAAPSTVTFSVSDGHALELNSLEIGHATDQGAVPDFAWTITIAESGGGPDLFTHVTAAMGAGDEESVAINFTGSVDTDYVLTLDNPTHQGRYGAMDNLSFSQVTPSGILLSGTSVASNAVIGTLVGDLSYTTNDQSGITYTLPVTATGPDSGSFQITSVTNLRTAATIAQASYAISVEAHSGGASLGTNDFTITVDPVASTYSAFVVSAEVQSGVASGGELVGVLQAEGADPSAFTFSLNSGRTDLFEIDGTGTNLVQVGGTSPGLAGAVNYIRIQAANAATTNNLVVAVQVVDGTPSGTLFMFK